MCLSLSFIFNKKQENGIDTEFANTVLNIMMVLIILPKASRDMISKRNSLKSSKADKNSYGSIKGRFIFR